MTFAPEAWPFVLPFWAFGGCFVLFGAFSWAAFFGVLGLLILLFFRNPKRKFDGSPDAILAPADGRVLSVERVVDPDLGEGDCWRVATFLSVFDVHVQRCPVTGKVARSVYRNGLKLAAFRPEAGSANESMTTVFETPSGVRIGVRQIAGLVARRVVAYRREGESCNRGDLLGIIKFGSRVDLFVPSSFRVAVLPGQRVQAGQTVLAEP